MDNLFPFRYAGTHPLVWRLLVWTLVNTFLFTAYAAGVTVGIKLTLAAF